MRLWAILVAMVLLALALVVLAPASLLTARIEAAIPGLRFEGVSGTVWNGRALALRVAERDRGALRWRVRPGHLARARLAIDIAVEGRSVGMEQRIAGRVWFTPGSRFGADGLEARLAAEEVLATAFQNTGLSPGGVVDLHFDAVEFQGRVPRAMAGRAVWREAVVSGLARAALGELTMSFALAQGRIVGELGDSGGPLALDGGFELAASGYRLDALLSARDPALAPALSYLGQPDGDGGRYLALRGGWLADWLESR